MTTRELASRAAPWTGLAVSLPGWAVHQQLLADMLHFDCRLGDTPAATAATAVIGILVAAAGAVSWQSRGGSELQRFIALLGAAAAAVSLFAIALQMLAATVLPGCGS